MIELKKRQAAKQAGRQECMIGVFWTALNDPDDDVAFAAKMQALRCLRARKKRGRK